MRTIDLQEPNKSMQDYISKQTYLRTELDRDEFVELQSPSYDRVQIDKMHPIYDQAEAIFTQSMFKYPTLPLFLGKFALKNEQIEGMDTNVLRLMIRTNTPGPIFIPKNLEPLAPLLLQNINYHRQYFAANADCFLYLTVRICDFETLYYKNSSEWHIDGFQGARIPRHKVEQNMFWSNVNPTEFSVQPYFCEGLNPAVHDINEFFDRNTDPSLSVKGLENGIYFVNPYHVHRVCPEPFDGKRVFVRLNFSPVLIEDSLNTINPYFPEATFASRQDVRNFLHEYEIDETRNNGFVSAFKKKKL